MIPSSLPTTLSCRGVIDGEAGHNTLDYAAYTTTRNFYLTGKGSLAGFDGKEASIDRMFRNITALIGGEAIDSLSGLDSDSVWRINGRNSGTYTTDNRTISFSFIDTLLGGAKSDRFCFQDKGPLTAMSMDAVVLILRLFSLSGGHLC